MNRTTGLLAGVMATTLAAIAAPAFAQTCEPARLAEKYPGLAGKTLRIGADPQTPPYVMREDGNFENVIGVDADLARAVFDCHGIDYEFFLGGWSGLLPAVIAGQIDVMWNNLYYTAERAKQVDYVIYMQAGTGAMARAGNPTGAEGIDQLCGLNVGVGLGTVEEAAMRTETAACAAAGKPEINVFTFPDVGTGARLLDSGRADILLWDLAFVDARVKESPEKYSRAFLILSGFQIGAGVRNGNDELLAAVREGLEIVEANGRRDEIFQAYSVDVELGLPAAVKTD
ncbi:MAG: ABC transporter substrate-binding protein [Pikeienuella sp.]|uniref:ABC transporter substrate-binding protein n=1 Tax=Pikeienuella sp. TaxID=2831957 RepID=UPI00391C6BAD